MADVVLGIDVGTTATKVTAYAVAGDALGRAAVEYPLEEPQPGQAVQDPEEIARAVLRATREAAAQARGAGAGVAGISVGSAMHSLIALDSRDRPLTPVLTWADVRAAEQAERLRSSPEGRRLHRRTGTPAHPMAPLAKLMWFRECASDVFATARRWVGIKEYVLARLTGEWAVDHSVASGTGLLDLDALDWDGEALALAGVGREQLARLVPTTHVLAGLTAAAAGETGLARTTPVVAGAGDGPLANVGAGAVLPGVAACSIGTSGALRVMVERPAVDPDGQVFCYALTPGRWVVGGAINNGGVVLRWAGDALAPDLGEHAERALLELAAQAPVGSGGLVMLPYLMTERAPHWSVLPRGAYVGLTHAHGRPHLVRAALEGVCQQLALVLRSLRAAGNEVRELRATGGFARSALWRQMLADALGMEIAFTAATEGTSFGAALLGMQALGLVEGVDRAAELVQVESVCRPDAAAAAAYAALLPVFAGLYDRLAPAFAELRRLGPSLPREPQRPTD